MVSRSTVRELKVVRNQQHSSSVLIFLPLGCEVRTLAENLPENFGTPFSAGVSLSIQPRPSGWSHRGGVPSEVSHPRSTVAVRISLALTYR
jgi:hypothetical protein